MQRYILYVHHDCDEMTPSIDVQTFNDPPYTLAAHACMNVLAGVPYHESGVCYQSITTAAFLVHDTWRRTQQDRAEHSIDDHHEY